MIVRVSAARHCICAATISAAFAVVSPASALQLCNGIIKVSPSEVRPMCSATWQLTATCTGEDLWDKWRVNGRTNPKEAFIKPFETVPIDVLGYELVNVSGRPASEFADSWFMIGSGMTGYPDAMVWLGAGESRSRIMFPSGFGQHWPSADAAQKGRLEDIIDVHGRCTGGKSVTLFLTVYYSPVDRKPSNTLSQKE